jgi:transcriptional regulator with XRE-family HTH domain
MEFSLESLGRAIAAERHRHGLTQMQFAKKAGVNRAYLSDVEQGHRNVTMDVLVRLALALDLNVSDLMVSAEQIQRAGTNDDAATTPRPRTNSTEPVSER